MYLDRVQSQRKIIVLLSFIYINPRIMSYVVFVIVLLCSQEIKPVLP